MSRYLLILSAAVQLAYGSSLHVYIAQSAAGAGDGTSCASARAYAYFNSSANWGSGATQIGPGTTVHICGALTGAAGADGFLEFQGSGTAGNPVTLVWELGAVVEAPYFVLGIGGSNRSYLTLDGGSNGIIRNSANGDALTYHVNSQLIDLDQCDNCTVKNLDIGPTFVHVRDTPEAGSGYDHQLILAGKFSGSNFLFDGNNVHDCGWCINHTYHPGQSIVTYSNNDIHDMDHGLALYPVTPTASMTNVFITQNRFHDTASWDCGSSGGIPDCHHDPIHAFASPTDTNSITGLYVSNNYFYGNMGTSTTGHVYVEGATSPAHIVTSHWWNNVFEVHSDAEQNTVGWVGVFSGSTQVVFVNNSIVGEGYNDITACYAIGYETTPTVFKNNMGTQCGSVIKTDNATSSAANWDYNYYGRTCYPMQTFNNCYQYGGGFLDSITNWQSTTGWDAHSSDAKDGDVYLVNSLLFNADGSPQAGSPVIGAGANLSSLATGYMASLAYDTTKGGTRSPVARPSSGAWDIGAYQYAAAPGTTSTFVGRFSGRLQ